MGINVKRGKQLSKGFPSQKVLILGQVNQVVNFFQNLINIRHQMLF